jgi:hypothetical protein
LNHKSVLMHVNYYPIILPDLLRQGRRALSSLRRTEIDTFAAAFRSKPELRGMVQTLFDVMLLRGNAESGTIETLSSLLDQHCFDPKHHEQIRTLLKEGRIGLAQNRLPTNAVIEDVLPGDVSFADGSFLPIGEEALRRGEAAVVTLAAGAGSRWTQGAGIVKALHPFCKFVGQHRTFLETHLAKSRRVSRRSGAPVPHIFTTSYMTFEPTAAFLASENNYHYVGPLILSQGKSVGLRMVPTKRDLRFACEEMPQQRLDEQQQKIRQSLRTALIAWASETGKQAITPTIFRFSACIRSGIGTRLQTCFATACSRGSFRSARN